MPELSGNFFVGRIFQHSDKDKDGYITVEDFTLAVERIGKVYSDEEKIRCKLPIPTLHSCQLLHVRYAAPGSVGSAAILMDFVSAVAFDLYDLDEDGFVSQRDLMGVLQHTSRSTVNPQQLERTVASLMQVNLFPGNLSLNLKPANLTLMLQTGSLHC